MKVFRVALRDFKATVLTKAFLIGAILPPLLMLVAAPLAIMLIKERPPAVKGTVAIIDQSGSAAPDSPAGPRVVSKLAPAAIREKLRLDLRDAKNRSAEAIEGMVGKDRAEQAKAMMDAQSEAIAGEAPELTPELLPVSPDVKDQVKALKDELLAPPAPDAAPRLAVVVIDPDAVGAEPGKPLGSYDLFVRAKLDIRVQQLLRRQVSEAVVDARLASAGHDPARLRDLLRLDPPEAREVTRAGEKKANELRQMMVPLAFMILLWVSVFAGGQMLLTSTIEEKSNRIMEVLLSAVSPMQLMTGKIVGQMAASLLILTLYSLFGVSALVAFNRSDLIEPLNLVYLVVFFFIAYFTIASMMAAIGSAVNDIHEANALMTPVMLVVMMPMLLMMPIIFNPKGVLATTLSFLPPINPFVMVLRVCSNDPPPTWQVLLSIAIGVVTVYVMLRLAAKVFRVGVLMYGKPPNFATLVRWVRMA